MTVKTRVPTESKPEEENSGKKGKSVKSVRIAEHMSIIDYIHDQMEDNPYYPSSLQSSWLPESNSPSMHKFFTQVLQAPPQDYAQCIKDLDSYITGNEVVTDLVNSACEENLDLVDSHLPGTETNNPDIPASSTDVYLPRIENKEALLNGFNHLLKVPPQFIDGQLVGLPFSAFVVGIDPTLSGRTLFGLPSFNQKMKAILADWTKYLTSEASNVGFRVEGEQWLSPAAKKSYQFEVWKTDNPTTPYWNSWDSFFTRQFKNRDISRPITKPDDNSSVSSANDGSLFRWDDNISERDVFWFKDMKYSLADILSSPNPAQQSIIDEHKLVEKFTDGYIFQTYLNPYNFHRWWCPVSGTVLFPPFEIDGCFFNKLVIPDFGGATTASLPYLAQVNARGLMVIETEDYGYVCCVPLGMSEVSSVQFDEAMKIPAHQVKKGDEMGMFHYGGSSYVMIFQKLPGKSLLFQNAEGIPFAKRPVLPKGSASTGGNVTMIGSQIGVWEDALCFVQSKESWQTVGYVNEGQTYTLKYKGGQWTSNPQLNNGNLFDANGDPSVQATQAGYPMMGQNEGALVARIGNNEPFLIGDGPVTTPVGHTGPLQLVINDDLQGLYGAGLTDNEGQIILEITDQPLPR